MLLKDFIAELSSQLLSLYPSGEAKATALRLCEDRLGVKSYTHIMEPLFEVPSDKEPLLNQDMSRLAAGEPLQYVLGHTSFCSHKFTVGPSVLIPRPETEQLCEYIIWLLKSSNPSFDGSGLRILDLCTGSGCIAWTMAAAFPKAETTGVDISTDALETAVSQKENFPEDFPAPAFIHADILSDNFSLSGEFDIVISNPPYVMESERESMRRNVLDFEPSLALFVPDADPLLFYRHIASVCRRSMSSEAMGFFEINEALGPSVVDLLLAEGFKDVNLAKDFSDKDRFVIFRK